MYDLIIIGLGPGGYEAALTALRKGLKIAIVEKDKLGGNCLNRACIPTKYFWTGAHNIEKLNILKNYGISFNGEANIDYSIAWENKEKAIGFLRKSLANLLKTKKVPVYKGNGRIIDKNKVKITNKDNAEEIIEGKNIIISTGSIPSSVGNIVPDGEYIITTEDYMDNLKSLPEKVLVIGGGVAGCELSYIMNKYGVKVYIVELMDRLLPSKNISPEISKYLLRKFKKLGITTFFNTTLEDYKIKNEKIEVKLSNGESLEVDKILLSVGRKPNSDVDEIGIEKDGKGFIKVNEYLQTNFENIYAVGDVINSPMLAHVAQYEAKIAMENILNNKKVSPDYSLIPFATFTAYEIATVGLNEEQAKEKGIDTISGYFPYTYNEKAVDESQTEGFIRLIFNKSDKTIIGGYIVGLGASELIHEISLMIKNRFTAKEVHEYIYFHPSLSEIFVYASYDIAVGKLF
ncbi:dihydrolipoyl dehydrogenase [Hydrogenothermus marinus]|uniref:Dihydrolipoyl dehydrogenase n=1 Tax=Hydrogenothermus marinus TaxID=133270 RepID=A0A3M0BG33_9AQUI|nr:dihydrolipoyl dehydrogenase [Hydrogenothermus marinus]RMA96101.1 dihydrolipoamide dehydrogenase [Hydrogenothermus marinus]